MTFHLKQNCKVSPAMTSLGSAIALLEQLHASGRRVGVVSHIEEVKERIPVKIAVVPVARGQSTIEIIED